MSNFRQFDRATGFLLPPGESAKLTQGRQTAGEALAEIGLELQRQDDFEALSRLRGGKSPLSLPAWGSLIDLQHAFHVGDKGCAWRPAGSPIAGCDAARSLYPDLTDLGFRCSGIGRLNESKQLATPDKIR
jgi:hypothetical protein